VDRVELLRVIRKAKESGQKELALRSQGITELPPEIGSLTNLTSMDLSYNQLSALPPEIGSLTNLTELNLSGNQLSALPPEIGRLTNLVTLDLGLGVPAWLLVLDSETDTPNRLVALPSEIGALTNLTTLDLQGIGLRALPPEIRNLTNLKELHLWDNPDLGIPPEITGGLLKPGDPAAILTYYFENVATEAATRPLNEVKLLLLGQGGVGKTSLVRRLLGKGFDADEERTERIAISDWQRDIGGDDIRVNVWDFGGQEIMHATHQFFLTERSLYLVVVDGREGEEVGRINYWLKVVRSFGGDSPVIVVANKMDQVPLELNERGLRREYPAIRDFVYTSARKGEGIDKLAAAIDAGIAAMEEVRRPMAATWFQVKERLEAMREREIPYITFKQYEDYCKKQGVNRVQSQETLIRYLHELGVALNFHQRHIRFLNTFIINPEWVTGGVYQIINAQEQIGPDGVLHTDQLSAILDKERYPRQMHSFILDVMDEFELCFDLRDGRYLIPDLLPKEEPALDWSLMDEGLLFQYEYEVLPGSVLSRFIVRALGAFEADALWRSGAVLRDDDNSALVYADRVDAGVQGHITIAVTGRPATRRDFLAHVRAYLRAIHATVPGLKVSEWVPIPGQPEVRVSYQDLVDCVEAGVDKVKAQGVKQWFDVQDLLGDILPSMAKMKELLAAGVKIEHVEHLHLGDRFDIGDITGTKGAAFGRGARAKAGD